MIKKLFSSMDPVTIVGGGAASLQDLEMAMAHGEDVIAADGGAELALQHAIQPAAVIGDLDSLGTCWRDRIDPDRVFQVDEQNSTDFEKTLMSVDAPLILGVGFTGARVDHELAALHALLRFSHVSVLLIGAHEVIFHCPPQFKLELIAGDVVSLFPLRAVQGTSTGLEWPIDGLHMAPGGQIGTSNRALGGPMELDMHGQGMLVLLPRDRLDVIVQAFAQVEAGWPAP